MYVPEQKKFGNIGMDNFKPYLGPGICGFNNREISRNHTKHWADEEKKT